MITVINKCANEIRKRNPSQETDSLFYFTHLYIYIAAVFSVSPQSLNRA